MCFLARKVRRIHISVQLLRLSYHFSVCCASVVDNANQSLNHLKYHKVIATQLPCGLSGPLRVRLPGAVSRFALLVIQPCIHECNVTQFLSNDVLQTLRNVKPCLSIWSTKLQMISQARPHYTFDGHTYIKPTTKHISTFLVNNLAFFCCFTHFELFREQQRCKVLSSVYTSVTHYRSMPACF